MRSLLFVPADSERKLEKGFQSGADVVIVDLEDFSGGAEQSLRPIACRRVPAGAAERYHGQRLHSRE